MNTYETIATVEGHGQIHVAGVPFAPGTEVEIMIKPARNGGHSPATTTDRAARLFAALDKARNIDSVEPLRREELYDRKVLH